MKKILLVLLMAPALCGAQTNINWTNVPAALALSLTDCSLVSTGALQRVRRAPLSLYPFDASGAALGATNGLGSAAFKATSFFDLAGTALSATNGLGTAAWHPATDFQAALGYVPATNSFAGITNALGYLPATNGAAASHTFSTNSSTQTPTFSFTQGVVYGDFATNAAFSFLAPANVSTTNYQTLVVLVTNTTAAAVAITAPSGVHTLGTWYVTNYTVVTFFNSGARITNAFALPVF